MSANQRPRKRKLSLPPGFQTKSLIGLLTPPGNHDPRESDSVAMKSVECESLDSVETDRNPTETLDSVKSTDLEHADTQSSCAEPNTAKLKIYDRNTNRSVCSTWFNEFPWLEHDKTRNLLRCRWCVRENKHNAFTLGKSDVLPKKDDLTKHSKTKDHQ